MLYLLGDRLTLIIHKTFKAFLFDSLTLCYMSTEQTSHKLVKPSMSSQGRTVLSGKCPSFATSLTPTQPSLCVAKPRLWRVARLLKYTFRSIVCEASCRPGTRSLIHLVIQSPSHSVIWLLGHVTLSLGHLVIRLLNHLVIRSPDHSVTWSLGHLVTQSLDHLIIWSPGHLVT